MGTYLPVGLIWAWNMLTAETTGSGALDNDFPLNAGYTAKEIAERGVRRAILLITDGNNSMFATPRNTPNTYDLPYKIQGPGQSAAAQLSEHHTDDE